MSHQYPLENNQKKPSLKQRFTHHVESLKPHFEAAAKQANNVAKHIGGVTQAFRDRIKERGILKNAKAAPDKDAPAASMAAAPTAEPAAPTPTEEGSPVLNPDSLERGVPAAKVAEKKEETPENANELPELSLVVVQAQGVEALAQHRADDALEVVDNRYKGFFGFFKRVGDNLTRPYRRGRAYTRARKAILDQQNIFGDPTKQAEHENEMTAIRSRFMEPGTELIHTDLQTPESKQEISDANNPIRAELIHLIRESIVQGTAYDDFADQQSDIFEKHGLYTKNSIMTDNIWHVVTALKALPPEQREKHLSKIKLILGTAQLGVRTDTHYNIIDRVVHRIESTPIARFCNPTTLAVAAATGVAAMQMIGRGTASVFAPVVGSTLFSGAMGYVQSSEAFKRDLYNDRRDAAMSQTFSGASQRRQALMEEVAVNGDIVSTRYSMMSATDLINELDVSTFPSNTPQNEAEFESAVTALLAKIGLLAEAKARVSLSNRQQIDLIRYSSPESIEQERLRLDVAIMRARNAAKSLSEHFTNTVAATYPGATSTIAAITDFGNDFDMQYRGLISNSEVILTHTNITSTNRRANSLRRRHARRSAAVAAGTSLAFAGITYAASGGFDNFMDNFRDKMPKGESSTLIMPGSRAEVSLANGEVIDQSTSGKGLDILRDGKVQVAGIEVGADGTLTDASVEKLEKAGYTPYEYTGWEEIVQSSKTIPMDPLTYLAEYKDKLVELSELGWAHNNTVPFDLNELKLDWGGANNTGITAGGDYAFSIDRMVDGGSFAGSEQFSPNADGKIYMALSITKDSQNFVFTFPFDSNGQAIIPADSDAAKMLFSKENGKAVFKGNFAHAMYFEEPPVAGGEAVRGVSLATHIGSNHAQNFDMTITEEVIKKHPPRLNIVPPVQTNDPIAVPFPLFLRSELERPVVEQKREKPEVPPTPTTTATQGEVLPEEPEEAIHTQSGMQAAGLPEVTTGYGATIGGIPMAAAQGAAVGAVSSHIAQNAFEERKNDNPEAPESAPETIPTPEEEDASTQKQNKIQAGNSLLGTETANISEDMPRPTIVLASSEIAKKAFENEVKKNDGREDHDSEVKRNELIKKMEDYIARGEYSEAELSNDLTQFVSAGGNLFDLPEAIEKAAFAQLDTPPSHEKKKTLSPQAKEIVKAIESRFQEIVRRGEQYPTDDLLRLLKVAYENGIKDTDLPNEVLMMVQQARTSVLERIENEISSDVYDGIEYPSERLQVFVERALMLGIAFEELPVRIQTLYRYAKSELIESMIKRTQDEETVATQFPSDTVLMQYEMARNLGIQDEDLPASLKVLFENARKDILGAITRRKDDENIDADIVLKAVQLNVDEQKIRFLVPGFDRILESQREEAAKKKMALRKPITLSIW